MSMTEKVLVTGSSSPMLSASTGTQYIFPLLWSTPPQYLLSVLMTDEMSMVVNVGVPEAYPGTGVRLRVSYVVGYE